MSSNAKQFDVDHTWWSDGAQGTSFGAPVVAAAVALMKDACHNRQPGSMLPQLVRANVMAGSYLFDPRGDGGYSTPVANCVPGDACDQRDGAGLLYGDALLDFCGHNLTGNRHSSSTVDLNPLGDPAQYSAPTPNDPKYGGPKVGFGLGSVYLEPAETLREVISWQHCARYNSTGDGNFTVDFDLWLYNHTTSQWQSAKSISYDDNNEGFPFRPQTAGTYEPIIVWKSGQSPCYAATPETVAEARVWGKFIPGPPP